MTTPNGVPRRYCQISTAGNYRYASGDLLARLDALEADR